MAVIATGEIDLRLSPGTVSRIENELSSATNRTAAKARGQFDTSLHGVGAGIEGDIGQSTGRAATKARGQMDESLKGTGKNLEGDLSASTGRAANAAKGQFHGAFAAISGLAGLEVVHVFGELISDANKAAVAAKDTEAVIKSTGSVAGITAGHIEDLTVKLSNLAGIDRELVHQNLNVLLSFTNIRNVGADKIFDQAALAAENLAARLHKDLQGATVVVAKALNDPIKGLTALGRVGIQFTVQQKDLIKHLVQTGDLLGAQKIILGELSTRFGGAAEAAATPAQKLAVSLQNAKIAIGTSLLPILNSIIGAFTNLSPGMQQAVIIGGLLVGVLAVLGPALVALPTVIAAISVAMGALGGVIAAVVAAFGPLLLVGAVIAVLAFVIYKNWDTIKAKTIEVFNAVKDTIVGAFGTVRDFVTGAISAIADAFSTGFGVLQGIVDSVFSGIQSTIDGVMAVIQGIIDNWFRIVLAIFTGGSSELLGLIVRNWSAIQDTIFHTVGAIVGIIAALPGQVIGFFTQLASTVLSIVTSLASGLLGILTALPGRIIAIFTSIVTGIVNAITALPGIVTRIFQSLASGAATGISNLLSFVAGIPGKIIRAFGNAGSLLFDVGKQIIQGLINGLKHLAGAAVDAVKGVAGGLVHGVKSLFGIGSPSKVFFEIGVNNMLGLINGIVGQQPAVQAALDATFSPRNLTINTTIPAPTVVTAPAAQAQLDTSAAALDGFAARVLQVAANIRARLTEILSPASLAGDGAVKIKALITDALQAVQDLLAAPRPLFATAGTPSPFTLPTLAPVALPTPPGFGPLNPTPGVPQTIDQRHYELHVTEVAQDPRSTAFAVAARLGAASTR